jgi:DtxR family Mn-dependent transcriptional regulator
VLAAKLGLAASSVTEMVKKLVVHGLVDHEPYGAVTLTPEGTTLALRMVRRHRIIETWLVSTFGYNWDEVHDEAEVLEHALSDRLLDAIDEQLGHPVRDPHGDPIPNAYGHLVRPAAVLLRDAPIGSVGHVVRISDRDPALLRHLAAEGIGLDTEIVVDGSLSPQALESIWITTTAP